MKFDGLSVKEVARIVSPLLKRNFLEWKNLKKQIIRQGKISLCGKDDGKIEKILSSEPMALFYAHWLKFENLKDSEKGLEEKMINYIKGLFTVETKDEKSVERLYSKCNLIAGLNRGKTIKIIDAALAMQGLMNKSFQEIFENENAYKAILNSALKAEDWKLSKLILMGWVSHFEIKQGDVVAFYRASNIIIEKREREIFS